MLTPAAVSINDVGFGYEPGRLLFEHVTFDLHRGTVTAVCGPSGRGKSTLLSLIAGLQQPLHGSIVGIDGLSSSWVLQVPIGSSRRTALDHVALILAGHGLRWREAERQALELLSALGLDSCAELPFGALSGGEAQRLMFACALAAESDIVLLDEPTASLDRSAAKVVAATVRATAQRGAIVVVATHDPDIAQACDVRIQL
jgi:lipoprotein-releasing system ATP-binding protein